MDFILNKIVETCTWDLPHKIRENLNLLKRRLEELNVLQSEMWSRRTDLHSRRIKMPKLINLWFTRVEDINCKTSDLELKVQKRNCLFRGFLKDDISRITQEVQELFQQGMSHYSWQPDNDVKMIGQTLRTENLIGADATREEIWRYLMCADVHRIAVCGIEGVGKTAIMKHINNQLLERTRKFNSVIWITVEKMSITQIQKRIASAMDEPLDECEDKIVRAGMIQAMLTRGKYVIILDGLNQENFSLEEAGIPDPSNGSKLVITTRQSNVGLHLDCQEVSLHTLSEPDALNLFLKKLGDVSNNLDLPPEVQLACRKCAGLPSEIISRATKMKVEIKMSLRCNVGQNAMKSLFFSATNYGMR